MLGNLLVIPILTCLVAFVLGTSLLQLELNSRIVGGVKINITNAPYQVPVLKNMGIICGGSIIKEKWILTAAHFTFGDKPHQLSVRVGSSEWATGGRIIRVLKIINHSMYKDKNEDYDFSLLELEEAIIFDKNQQKINLIGQNKNVPDGEMCIITGWGDTLNINETSDWLRSANVPIVNHKLCNLYNLGKITERMICAGYEFGKKDTCQRDSGGPLVCKNILVGVTSWGYGCAEPKSPGVYSKIAYVRNWIDRNINN